MSTKAQRCANQRNAQLSTGPKTGEGKQRSSQNALKHGLRAKYPVIPGEDPAEYQRKLDQLRNDVRPANAIEDDLVEQIADTSWRLKRLSRIEAAIERHRIESAAGDNRNRGKDGEQTLGSAFTGWALLDYMSRLGRYEAQLSRRYQRALKDLRDLRKDGTDILFRIRPMEQRDEEERQWRAPHPPQPPEEPTRPAATGAPTIGAGPAHNNERIERTELTLKDLESMTPDEFDELHPDQILKFIAQDLEVKLPIPGHPGPQEARK